MIHVQTFRLCCKLKSAVIVQRKACVMGSMLLIPFHIGGSEPHYVNKGRN